MNIFAESTDLALLEEKTQNQAASPAITDFSGSLRVNGVPVSAGGPFLPLAGGTMSGNIDMGAQQITNVSAIRTSNNNVVMGTSAATSSVRDVIIGNAATVTTGSNDCVLIGSSATGTSSGDSSVIIGASANSQGTNSVLIGKSATMGTGPFNVLIGETANISGASNSAVIIGRGATCTAGNFGVAVGYNTSINTGSACVVGGGATSTAVRANCFGDGLTNATAGSLLIQATTNLRANSTTCDLGTATFPFQSGYFNGSLIGPTNSRTVDNIVSNVGASVNNRVAVFSGTTGKLITDSGATLSQYLPLAGGTMSGNILMNGNVIDVRALNNSLDNGQFWGMGASVLANQNNTAIGRFVQVTSTDGIGFGRDMTISGQASTSIGQGCNNAGFASVAIGPFATVTNGQSHIAIGQNATAGAALTNFCIAIGQACTNTTGNSALIGDPAIANIRANSTVCDLGTSAAPFKTLYLNSGVEGTGALTIGPTTATSLTLGRSTVTTLVNGIFACTVPAGSWYSTTTYNPTFTAATNRLTPPTAATAGTLTEFTHSLGVLTYTGTRTRTFRMNFNITFTSGASGANMIFFISKNASTTIGTQAQQRYQIGASNNTMQICVNVTDVVSLATNDTVQLAGQCATSTAAVAYNFVSCNVNGITN